MLHYTIELTDSPKVKKVKQSKHSTRKVYADTLLYVI